MRDNGSGIFFFDFNVFGCFLYMSKFSFFEDIDKIGGKFFGFCGIVLVSINMVVIVYVIMRVGLEIF